MLHELSDFTIVKQPQMFPRNGRSVHHPDVSYQRNAHMTEHISCEGHVVFCIDSYFHGTPTHLLVEALEPTIICEMPRDRMEALAETNPGLAYLYRRFLEDSLILSQTKADILRFESAKDRYTKLLQLFPEIIRRAPLTYVASYLQMSLETLSRVRASISTQP